MDGSVVYEKIRTSGKVGYGYNAYTEEYVDMIPAGIVDPTKVTRSALENAASIAACVLTTESAEKTKPKMLQRLPPLQHFLKFAVFVHNEPSNVV